MSELRTQLEAAVGASYRIERELGGGGMSRVFLAEETALGRRVVIKVLPPEMSAGVNKERFQREIQLAARLQHPHIVPLLTAGAAGDLLYYIMPYIEGESLRAKLAREGELPVGEAVRLLREVVDALAYAHANDVVHRDVKPDNVLVSGKHALVTDFGVAKAVSASSGGTLTSLGMALGTPAYMAPEQAAGDPHVDYRADLYAVGAMAYEMLCGRPPFAAPTPQAVLAAHVTQAPEPVVAHRDTVPPALNELVMRCLAKKPADRWQSAEELATLLEAMTTPPTTTPVATQPVTLPAASPARSAHPVRVGALFGIAAAAVLAVVWGLMMALGLPGWVLGVAVGLLAVGLPIMLLTSHHERRRALTRTTGMHVPTPSEGLRAFFTWRRAILGGVLAFAALGVLTAGYSMMRVLGIGPVGTLVGAGVIEARAPVLLADFVNRTADSTLGATLTEAFRVDLAQSRIVRLVDPEAVGDALRRMGRPAGTRLMPALAREVAQREGISAIITGQVDPVGEGYLMTASVVAAADGRVLTAVRASAADPGQVIAALDGLSRDLRERIGESLKTIRATPSLSQVTTPSLEALRRYTLALQTADFGDEERAIGLLEEATALDSTFAMAYRKVAVLLGNMNASAERITAATSRAYAHRDRLAPLERYLTIAQYHTAVEFDRAKIIDAYRGALEIAPENDIALNNLGNELSAEARYAAAESLFARVIELGYGGVTWGNLARMQAVQGRFDDADSTLARYERASPRDPGVLAARAHVAAARRDYRAVAQAAAVMEATAGGSSFWRQQAGWLLAASAAVLGQLGESRRHLHSAMAEGERRGLPRDYLMGAVALARMELVYGGGADAALDTLDAALALHPLASLSAADRPYPQLARVYAEAGRPDRARELLDRYEREVPEGRRVSEPERHAARAAVAEAEDRPRDALSAYAAWRDEIRGCLICGVFEQASVYDALGEPDSALAYYERFRNAPAPFRWLGDPSDLARGLQRLGELYEERGDRERALAAYIELLEQWSDAGPELAARVADIRARTARLAGER